MAGRFAASVQDLNNHKNAGSAHSATNIITNVSVNGVPQTTVAGALTALNSYIGSNVPPNATSLAAGIIKLANDLGGTALLPQVTGILGYQVDNSGIGDLSTIYFDSGQWRTGALPVSGDLQSFDESGQKRQRVMTISGNIGNNNPVTFTKTLRYSGTSNLQIDSVAKTGISDTPLDTYIYGNSLTHASNTNHGGSIYLIPGQSSGKMGHVNLTIGSAQFYSLNTGSSRLNILGGNSVFSPAAAQSSFGSIGGHVNLIGNSAEPAATTSIGAILYANTGALKYRNNGSSKGYWVGNPENPEIWRDVADNNSGSIYRERFTALHAINTVTDIKTYSVTNNAIFSNTYPKMIQVRVKVTAVANSTGADARSSELVATFKVLASGPTVSQVGITVLLWDVGSNITNPTITFTGTNIRITSAAHASQQCRAHYQVEIMQY